jgi:hypothetical protein
VNWVGKSLIGAAGLGLLTAGCAAASHLTALQPSIPLSPSAAAAATRHTMQLGIDVDAYTYKGENIPAAATAVVNYALSLHANAISITFPFFMRGPHSPSVSRRAATPTPRELVAITRKAEAKGLYVAYRPLLDEASIDYGFRGNLRLSHPAEWFASYRRFLLPYAKAAQRSDAQEFVVGTELSSLYTSPRWYPLDTAVRRVFHGRLAFDSNWYGVSSLKGAGGKGLTEGVDAYPAIPTHIAEGWKLYDHRLPRGTVEMEVGIAAVRGAFAAPYKHNWPGKPIDGKVQAQWFTAACHAAAAEHLGGIYFWSVTLGTSFPGPSPGSPLSWGDASPGARTISACFASLRRKVAG